MREPTIARNYAEALFESGERTGNTESYADLVEAVAGAIAADDRVRTVLESPRVTKAQKQEILSQALGSRAPEPFVRFLRAVVKRGRQGIFGAIAHEFLGLVDVKLNRVHASVILARKPDPELQQEIAERLSRIVGKTVVSHVREDRAILGGIIVRMGDRVMDGSLRRKMLMLRRKMLGA
ncbi:MAG: ATP synthase F1 subunit delta [Gemmatimonadetes bacterium]|nr:ATP synthase F1 subunit delta [Gemmatimonadota bacterium]